MFMITIRKLIPLLFAAIAAIKGYGQQSTPSTPGANGAGSNGATSAGSIYNVNLYDGTANINIPIYAYSVDGLDLGVSLGYNTRGVQLDQTSGMCGLGWNLAPDYSITRQVNGVPDELKFPGLHYKANTPNGSGGYFDTSLGGPVWGTEGTWSHDNDYPINETNQDIFYASLPGRSLRFCNNSNGYKVFPKSEVTISGGISPGFAINGKTDTTSHVSFVIHDEKGNEYTFDRVDYEIHPWSDPNARDNYIYHQTSKWLLTKIFTYTGQLILYHYATIYGISFPQSREQKVLEEQDHTELYNNSYYNQHFNASIKALVDSNVIWNGTISYLTDIVYPNGTTVYFNYEADPNKPRCDLNRGQVLTSIKVQSGYDANLTNALTYNLNYAYFHSPSSVSATELPYGSPCNSIGNIVTPRMASPQDPQTGLRLKLKSIDKVGADNTTKEQYYSFDYNSTAMKDRLSPSKDYYGYYNGQSPTYSHTGASVDSGFNNLFILDYVAIPYHEFTLSGGGATYMYGLIRNPDFSKMQAWNLTHITNGMGGSVDLYYQMHQLYNPDNAYNDASYSIKRAIDQEGRNAPDGLCIDSIVVKDGYNTDNTTSLKYVFDHGERFFRGGYFWDPKYYDYASGGLTVYAQYYFNDFINPMQFVNGSNHGYSFATVKNYGFNNQFLGATKYHFSNLMTEADTNISNLTVTSYYYNPAGAYSITHNSIFYHRMHPVSMAEYNMGLSLGTSSYNRNWDLVSDVQNTYVTNGTDFVINSPAQTVVYNHGTLSDDAAYDYYYPFRIIKSLQKTSTTTMYANGQSSSTTLTNDFDANDNITTVHWQDSKGDNYHKDYGYSSGAQYQFLTSSRIIKEDGGAGQVVAADYSATPARYIGGGNGYYDFHSLTAVAPIPANVLTTANTPQTKNHGFDAHANPTETIYDGGVHHDAAFWDTRIGQKVADVTNAWYTDVAYTSFEGTFAPLGTTDDKGNWDFNPANIDYYSGTSGSYAMTGHYAYHLVSGATVTSTVIPQSSKQYKISFWGYGGVKVMLGGGQVMVSQVDAVGNWSLYSGTFTGDGSSPVTVSGLLSNAHVDELRLYPAEAAMTTRTYDPLLGVNSTCNERNDIVYYEYDAMGRLKLTRDIEHNIISLTKQTVQGGDY
jgi:hypothetical protein